MDPKPARQRMRLSLDVLVVIAMLFAAQMVGSAPTRSWAAPAHQDETPIEQTPVAEGEVPVEPTPVVEGELPVEPIPTPEGELPVEPTPVLEGEEPIEPTPVVEGELPVEGGELPNTDLPPVAGSEAPTGLDADAATQRRAFLPMMRTASSTGAVAGAFYVSPSGNDGNPGTQAQPWRTLAKAASTAGAGTTVYLTNGTYNERLVPKKSGASGSPITFAAYPGHAPRLDGNGISLNNFQGLVEITGKNYIRISGLTLTNSLGVGILTSNAWHVQLDGNKISNSVASGIGIWNGGDVTVQGNDLANSCTGGSNEALTVSGVDGFAIVSNHVHNEGVAGKEGIDAKQGARNGIISGNVVHHTRSVAIYVDAYDKHTYNIEVSGNLVYQNSNGIALGAEMGGLLENIRIYNNVSYNNSYCGIRAFNDDPSSPVHPMKNVKIINNTTYGNASGGCGAGILIANTQIEAFVIRNNIASNNATGQIRAGNGVPLNQITSDHNLVYGATISDELRGTACLTANPLFSNPGAGNFQLQAGSPGVNTGSGASAPPIDHAGVPRPQSGAPDIGAYER